MNFQFGIPVFIRFFHISMIGLFFLCAISSEYVPVVFIYGLSANQNIFNKMRRQLTKMYPGIYTTSKKIGCGGMSSITWNIQKQVDYFAKKVKMDPKLQQGFNIFAHSQGGIIGRAYIEQYNDPPVKRFITVAAPNAGIYCSSLQTCPSSFGVFARFFEENVYSKYVQKHLAIANYWRSPIDNQKYLNSDAILPVIDNEIIFNQTYKDNILKLDYFIMVGSERDGTIAPWESQFFGYYKIDDFTYSVENLTERSIYLEDRIGLRTLDETNRLITIVSPGIKHNFYRHKIYRKWMKKYVLSWYNHTFDDQNEQQSK